MFQRRHYKKMAEIIKETCKEMDIATIDHLISTFVHHLYLDNKNFKPDVFAKACGLPVDFFGGVDWDFQTRN